MRVLSPDAINEIKEDHTGLYVIGVMVGAALFFIILITFGVLRILIETAIKHYYYALGIVALFFFLRIRKRKKKAKERLQYEYPYR